MQILATIAFIAKNPSATVICKQRLGVTNVMFIGKGKNKITNHAIVGYLKMKSIAKECLAKPFSICTGLLKLLCKSGSYKFTYLYGHAVNYLKVFILGIAQVFKKSLFYIAQIGTLTDKVTPVRQVGKKKLPMARLKSMLDFVQYLHRSN